MEKYETVNPGEDWMAEYLRRKCLVTNVDGRYFRGKDPTYGNFIDMRPAQLIQINSQSSIRYSDGMRSACMNLHKAIVDELDNQILNAIIDVARQGGVDNLLVLNKHAIVQALREYEERHLQGER